MQEVTNQVAPLTSRVERMDRTLRSLYRNGGEGAPGYLETARDIDNGRFDMIFNMLQEFKDTLKPVTKFMDEHESREEQKTKDNSQLEKRFNTRLTVIGLIFAAISILSANMQGCKNATKSFFSGENSVHPVLSLPQNSQTTADYHPEKVTK